MPKARSRKLASLFCSVLAISTAGLSAFGSTSIVVSVPDQKLALVRDGKRVAQYKISTSRFGLGDKAGSYATPLGKLEIAARIGDGLAPGAVLKGRHATGEILPVNADGRDPIVTRILHLRGLEPGNDNAYGRLIYIHGTPVERTIGKPDSYGCVRMKSKDIIELFESVPVGTQVEIVNEPMRKVMTAALAASAPPVAENGTLVAVPAPEPAAESVKTPPGATPAPPMPSVATRSTARTQKQRLLSSVATLPLLGGTEFLKDGKPRGSH